MRVLAAFIFLLLLGTFSPLALYRDPPLPARSFVSFAPVPLDRSNSSRSKLGRLVFLEGWQARSNDPRFGGISAMHVEGRSVIALSDSGSLMRFELPGPRRGPASIFTLRDGPGSPSSKFDRDTEAMVVDRGRAWVVYERDNSIWRYEIGNWRSRAAAAPSQMADWSANSGGEAIVRLGDGRFMAFSEAYKRKDGSTDAVLFSGDPIRQATRAVKLGYRAPAGYRITDAAALPGGGILFLNRSFDIFEGFKAKLTLAREPSLRAGAVIEGEEIANLETPVSVDNMEALSVAEEDGRTILWIASDDNLTSLQRTLFLKFALNP